MVERFLNAGACNSLSSRTQIRVSRLTARGRLYVVNLQLGIVRIDLGSGAQEIYAARVCTKTTHVSEWMINSNLPVANVNLEFHQRELVDRSFSLKEAVMEKSTN
jgi:hypothetical protein